MGIHIVTDSSCDLPPVVAAQHAVTVVPLTVRVNGQEYFEGVNISAEDFVRELQLSDNLPQTSQPSPQAFLNAFEGIARRAGEAAEVLCITLSSKLSGTFQSAMTAQRMFRGKVAVFDSLSGTIGLGVIALNAAHLVKAGLSLGDILDKLHDLRGRLTVIVGVNSLENAVKGGRVSRVHAAVAQVLRMKFLMRSVEGQVEVFDRVRGRKGLFNAFLHAMETKGISYHDRTIGISHVDNATDAQALADAIQQKYMPREIIIAPMGSTIATYAGIGAIAVAF